MSTGKRLAKRSIIGTRVCAPGEDGKFYSGVIQAVKTPVKWPENSNSINLTPSTRYTVRFDSRQGNLGKTTAEFQEKDLIGPGFQSVLGVELVGGQKCFVTHNGREISGEVCKHYAETDEVIIRIHPFGIEAPFEVQKRLEEVRLLESRKSARLADQDTDFARLADMAGDRKKSFSHIIDVPTAISHALARKRRTSDNHEERVRDTQMDECSAALVLMSLSCSPKTTNLVFPIRGSSRSNSCSPSYRSTPSPPPNNSTVLPFSTSAVSDEGIVMDFFTDDFPKKKMSFRRIVFQCTWPSCHAITDTCETIEAHVRTEHLKDRVCEDAEEEFYYTELELNMASPPPTVSHQDMARPFHEDPDYQRLLVGCMRRNLRIGPSFTHKLLKMSARARSPKIPFSPRRPKGDKKCRKMYGVVQREQWCTQCKWKKACSRFSSCGKA